MYILDKNYKLNGAIYICKTDSLIKEQGFFLEDNIYAFIMDRLSSVDIDQDIDFKIAKALIFDVLPWSVAIPVVVYRFKCSTDMYPSLEAK